MNIFFYNLFFFHFFIFFIFFLFFSFSGTARFVKNTCVWFLGLDNRIAIDAPIRGKISQKSKQTKAAWFFSHNGWHRYDADASGVVEAAYQDYLKNPWTDVRAVKSGQFHYSVDFTRMKQKNLEHWAHTERVCFIPFILLFFISCL